MGCGSSQPKISSQETTESIGGVLGGVNKPSYKEIHSACRWNTKTLDELRIILRAPGAVTSVDESNGNTPLHIAAQNGHDEIVDLIISIGGKTVLNVQNLSGNTPLHMAIEYDYYGSAKALINAGADENISNQQDYPAKKGIEGLKHYLYLPLFAATSEAEILNYLEECEKKADELEKSSFAGLALKLKKNLSPEIWTEECKTKFKLVLKAIPS